MNTVYLLLIVDGGTNVCLNKRITKQFHKNRHSATSLRCMLAATATKTSGSTLEAVAVTGLHAWD